MSAREDREAAMIAHNGPDSVNRPRHREWIERGGDDCGATVYEVAQAIANARAEGYARGQRAIASHTAAAVERERERCAVVAGDLAEQVERDAAFAGGAHPGYAAMLATARDLRTVERRIRSRPPRAGEGG